MALPNKIGGSDFAKSSVPAANTQATTSIAATAGVRNVCTSLSVMLSAGASASSVVIVYLRDGLTGVGTPLWGKSFSVPANGTVEIDENFGDGLVGTPGNAMTLEFTGAAGATTQESVNFNGYQATAT